MEAVTMKGASLQSYGVLDVLGEAGHCSRTNRHTAAVGISVLKATTLAMVYPFLGSMLVNASIAIDAGFDERPQREQASEDSNRLEQDKGSWFGQELNWESPIFVRMGKCGLFGDWF